jgi:dienelactone hydrolase
VGVSILSMTAEPSEIFLAPVGLGAVGQGDSATIPVDQESIRQQLPAVLGESAFAEPPPLNLRVVETHDDGDLWRYKLRYGNDTDDTVWAWLFVSKAIVSPAPAVICLAGSFMTPNWGKDAPAGLGGPLVEGDPEAYGRDLARRGFVTLCPDYPCCGERTTPGLRSHDTGELDARFPNWSRVGLSTWDVSRGVDVLSERPEVDAERIGTCGWSQGGQMAILGAAFDARIAAVVSICGWGPLRGVGGRRAANWVQSYNFPKLVPYLHEQKPLPFDFDDIVACLAPRPFLDVRAAQDETFPNRHEQAQALTRLAGIWDRAGGEEHFRTIEVPGDPAHGAIAAGEQLRWLRRWL